MYSKKQIEAIRIVQSLTREQMQLIDHFYQGDKDTYEEAFDALMADFGIDQFYWEMDPDVREGYRQQYKKEISDKLNELVDWGKKEMLMLKQFDDFLEGLVDHLEINLNCNVFEFPEGIVEIDSDSFDPLNN